jgi:hypothetical protein
MLSSANDDMFDAMLMAYRCSIAPREYIGVAAPPPKYWGCKISDLRANVRAWLITKAIRTLCYVSPNFFLAESITH